MVGIGVMRVSMDRWWRERDKRLPSTYVREGFATLESHVKFACRAKVAVLLKDLLAVSFELRAVYRVRSATVSGPPSGGPSTIAQEGAVLAATDTSQR